MTRLKQEYEKLPRHWTMIGRLSEALERVLNDERPAVVGVDMAGDDDRTVTMTVHYESYQPPWHEAPEGAEYAVWLEEPQKWLYYSYNIHGEYFVRREDTPLWEKGRRIRPLHGPLIPRPTQQWRGPEDGLPPVGTVCAYRTALGRWVGAKVLAIGHDHEYTVAYLQLENYTTESAEPERFRPIPTDRERWVDQAAQHVDSMGFASDQLTKIHDALLNGSLPVPGGSEGGDEK